MRDPSGVLLPTVWILGAGFSRSLGGPLLDELLVQSNEDDLADLFSRDVYGKALAFQVSSAQRIFNQGLKEKQWSDPEQFLDAVEASLVGAPGGSRWDRLWSRSHQKRVVGKGPNRAADHLVNAKRALAADCTLFLRTAEPSSERWSPYRGWVEWMKKLIDESPADAPRHTVITFNYDRVLELVDPKQESLQVVLPGSEPDKSRISVLKLHGSVDWKVNGHGSVAIGRPEEALLCRPEELAMATPGRAKVDVAEKLDKLWVLAEEALKRAAVVVFLGYRFPPGDANARKRLLRVIVQNEAAHLAIVTVLGPNLQSPDAIRLRRLLERAVFQERREGWFSPGMSSKTFHFAHEPMNAEDYLSLFGELNLFQFRR